MTQMHMTLDPQKTVAFLLTARGTETKRYLFPDHVALTGMWSHLALEALNTLDLLYLGDNGFERLAQLRYRHDYTLYGTTSIKLTFKLDSEHMRKTHDLPGAEPRLWCLSLVG